MKIVFFGTPKFASVSLLALLDYGIKPSLVITKPLTGKTTIDRESIPVYFLAKENGITVLTPKGKLIEEKKLLSTISSLKPELGVVVAYGKILPPELFNLFKYGCINIHASLLPKLRGPAPVEWAIMKGFTETGVTIMQIDEGIDTGPIYLQAKTKIFPDENSQEVKSRLAYLGSSLLIETIKGIFTNSLVPKPQTGNPTYAPFIKKENCIINFSCKASEIYNLYRALVPKRQPFFYKKGEEIKVHSMRIANLAQQNDQTCRIKGVSGKGIIVSCSVGDLILERLQRPGRKIVTGIDFVNGLRLKVGDYICDYA